MICSRIPKSGHLVCFGGSVRTSGKEVLQLLWVKPIYTWKQFNERKLSAVFGV